METLEEFNENINKCKSDVASPLIVAVITVCANFGTNFDLEKIYELYVKNEITNKFILNFVQNSKKIVQKKKAFYNCLSVIYDYTDINGITSHIAAKIFPNGSIQLPGCRTYLTVNGATNMLYDYMIDICKQYPEILLDKSKPLILSNIRIVMIDSNFIFQSNNNQVGIYQEKLKNLINLEKFNGNNGVWRIATYQPEKYAGVNIRYWTKHARDKYKNHILTESKLPKKIEGQVSIFVFRSGKATITAAKNSTHLLEAYNAICNIVRLNNVFIL